MEDGTQIRLSPVKLGPIHRIASYNETIYILRPGEIATFDGQTVDENFIDWGRLPSSHTNDLLQQGNQLFIGTQRGLSVLRGASLTHLQGKDGLPVEATTCLNKGFDHDLWIGTERGAIRMTKEGEFQYFGEGNWLPDAKVNSVTVGENEVYIATDKGIGIIKYEPFTLLKKAHWFEKYLDEWGYKRMGFVHYLYQKEGRWIREITDNDGEHTAYYLAAMCYKYAATGDSRAKEEAIKSFHAMTWLQEITGRSGLLARAIWSSADEDERAKGGSGGLPAKWYPTSDGKWYWKGDVSSDEVIAHFYAVSIFHDLVAKGTDKEKAQKHLTQMASYIIENGWKVIDPDGKPTRWGRWDPEYLLQPYGYQDRGLNGLEALAFTRTATQLSDDAQFTEGYQQLINWGYPENTIRQKTTFPPADIAPWDDDLAFMAYNTLLRYEEDPRLRSIYLRSLARTWTIKRIDRSPWYNFIYAAISGNEGDFNASMSTLRARTMDCTEKDFHNSHRDDLFIRPGYHSYDGRIAMFSPREVFMEDKEREPGELDGGSNGRRAKPPTDFLLSYWMGRYYGFILAPETQDSDLLSAEKKDIPTGGAVPYTGESWK